MKKYLTAVLLILCFFSCKTITYKLYGIKKPKEENIKSINSYLSSIKCDTLNNYIAKPESYQKLLMLVGNRIPNALIFDSISKNIVYHPKDSKCDGFMKPFLTGIDTVQNFVISDSVEIAEILSLTDFDKNINSLKQKNTIIIFWAVFIGRLNKTFVKEWDEIAKIKNLNAIIINLDMQDTWSDEQLKN